MIVVETESSSDQDLFWGFNTYDNPWTAVPSNATSMDRHIGFFVDDGALYASNADGVTQTKTLISGVTITNKNKYRFAFTAGQSIRFYVNDELKATHITHLPNGSSDHPTLWIGVANAGTNSERQILIHNDYRILVFP